MTPTRLSGVADYLADNDTHALSLTRMIVNDLTSMPKYSRRKYKHPRLDIEDLLGFIHTDTKKALMLELIGRIVDDSNFHEFKATYGETLVCGFAKICESVLV